MKFDDDERAVERFKQFLRIKTVSAEGPSGSYQEAVDFLIPLLEEIGLSHTTYEFVPGKPVLMATWTGSDPSLPGILLNSHYDVVCKLHECVC